MAIANDVLYRSEKGSALTFAELDNNFNILAVAIDNIQISNNSVVVVRDLAGNFSANTITANLAGNSATSTKLLTARTINGVSFDGTANITVTANTNQTLTRGTYLTGLNFNGSAATTWAVDADSLATASKVVARDSSGNFNANTINAALVGNASTATTLQTARTIGDVSFNGSASIAPERIMYKDTRGTDFVPYTHPGVTLHLKTNTTDGLNDSGTYHGILNLVHWGDVSGGRSHQLGFTDAGNVHHRSSTNTTIWSTWSKLYDTADAASTATANTLVLRDSSGNFSANTITASSFSGSFTGTIAGNASTATTLQTARTINGVSFNGSADITVTANTNTAATFNNGGTGAASGTTFDGSTSRTISYNTVGASPLAGSSSLTTTGTITSGTWNGSIIGGTYGGTGVNNGSNTITLGGNLTTSGAFAITLTATGSTNVTLPTTGTLATTSDLSQFAGSASLTTVGTITSGVWNAGTVTANGNITSDGNVTSVNLIPDKGATNGYLSAVGLNVSFNGTNWVTVGDGSSSGASAIGTNYGDGAVRFYTIPSTASSGQTLTPVQFAATERMRIDASGNVGMSTTDPTYQLTVGGYNQETPALTDAGSKGGSIYLRADAVSANSGGAVLFGTTFGNGTPFAAIKALVVDGANNTRGDLAFSTRNATTDTALTERLRIGSSGQVGIGGANYGTSGQVLTSGGASVAPSWASVGTATSGLAYGDVGSYGWFYYSGLGSNNPGALLSGANLYPANSYQNGTSAGYYTGGGAVGGTWRLMGETGRYNGTTILSRADMSVSLFLRVS